VLKRRAVLKQKQVSSNVISIKVKFKYCYESSNITAYEQQAFFFIAAQHMLLKQA
jgi:hypothetical protein